MKKIRKRTTALALCLVIALVAIIGGSLAYFSYISETKENVFKFVGSGPGIEVNEPSWDENVDHPLVPGVEMAKDPYIKNVGDVDMWVFFKIEADNYHKLLNLMGREAYANKEAYPGLTGAYPGLEAFVNQVVADPALFRQVIDHWFRGIEHQDWCLMNAERVRETVLAAAAAITSGTAPPTSKIALIVGYQGPCYQQRYDGAAGVWKDIGPENKGGVIPKITSADPDNPQDGDIRYDKITFMTAVTPPADVDKDMLYGNADPQLNYTAGECMNLDFTGCAIQAKEDGQTGDKLLDTLDKAYAALFPEEAAAG